METITNSYDKYHFQGSYLKFTVGQVLITSFIVTVHKSMLLCNKSWLHILSAQP